jgi:hypothetical protein
MSYNPQNPNGQANMANSAPVVIASDQTAVPVSGSVAIGANSSVNVAQVAGTATDVNSGLKSAGTQRMVLATDQPQLTNALKVDGSAVTQPISGTVTANAGTGTFTIQSNASINNAQVGGNAIATGNGATNTGTQRVTISSDSTGQVALASGATVGINAGSNTIGNVGINAGTNAIGTINVSPAASGGWSVSSQTSLTSTATVSGAAGKFGGYMFINTNASVAYMQVFDTTGAVTLGTTVPTFVVPIPAGAGANLEITNGIAIASGIKVAATTTPTGATTVSTGLTGFVLFK